MPPDAGGHTGPGALIRHWLELDAVDDLVSLGMYALDQLNFGGGLQ